jgi:hypothetical protein
VAADGGDVDDLVETDEARVEDHAVADHVDAAPAGSAGELGVVTGLEEGVSLPVELGERVEHDRPGRHVDPERQRLGGEHDFEEPG